MVSPAARIAAIAAAGALAVAIACSVDRRTPALECTTNGDCAPDRTCQMGYCVTGGSSSCPQPCTSCNTTTTPPTCTVFGSNGNDIACPAGYDCAITCTRSGACGNVSCGSAPSCTVDCQQHSACAAISCGSGGKGSCSVTCTVPGACGTVTCNAACSCSVMCGNGACGAIMCPRSSTGNNPFCTPTGSDGLPCITSPPGCAC